MENTNLIGLSGTICGLPWQCGVVRQYQAGVLVCVIQKLYVYLPPILMGYLNGNFDQT